MNKTGTAVLFGGLFGILGCTIGYFIAKKRYLTLADKEIASIKAHQVDHDRYLLNLYGVKLPNKETTENKKAENDKKMAEYNKKDIENTQKLVDYTKPYAPSEEIYNAPIKSHIYLISDESFEESLNNYETLYYYNRDGVVSDNDDNCVNNFVGLIGPSELWLDKLISNGRAVYIRNDNLEMDYELLFKDESWDSVATPTQKAALFYEVDSDLHDKP